MITVVAIMAIGILVGYLLRQKRKHLIGFLRKAYNVGRHIPAAFLTRNLAIGTNEGNHKEPANAGWQGVHNQRCGCSGQHSTFVGGYRLFFKKDEEKQKE